MQHFKFFQIHIFIFFLSLVILSFCSRAKNKSNLIAFSPSNLHSCDDNTGDGVDVNCFNISISNKYNDTIWIQRQEINNQIISDFYFCYIDSVGNVIYDEYKQDLTFGTDFAPVPPGESRLFNGEYLSQTTISAKRFYLKVNIALLTNIQNVDIKGVSKNVQGGFSNDTLYKPEYLFEINEDRTFYNSNVNFDSLWQAN